MSLYAAADIIKLGTQEHDKNIRQEEEDQQRRFQRAWHYNSGSVGVGVGGGDHEMQAGMSSSSYNNDYNHNHNHNHNNEGDEKYDGDGNDTEQQQRQYSAAKLYTKTFLRFFQFVLGLTVIGLYGHYLQLACAGQVYADAKYVYATVTGSLASATSMMHLVTWLCVKERARPALTSYHSMHLPFFIWEVVLCILWLTLFGIFGKMFIIEDPEGLVGTVIMKNAVWVDLVSLVLWILTAAWTGVRWWRSRPRKKVQDQDQDRDDDRERDYSQDQDYNHDEGYAHSQDQGQDHDQDRRRDRDRDSDHDREEERERERSRDPSVYEDARNSGSRAS